MTTYLYRCPSCAARFEAAASTERLAVCRKPGCTGMPERIPGVAFHRDGASS